jgi:hypothetical protein
MPPAGFEPATPATKRLQTHVLDGAATGIGFKYNRQDIFLLLVIPLGGTASAAASAANCSP